MAGTIQPFVEHSAEVNLVLMEVLAKRLGFREGLLVAKHRLEETSGSETRCIKNPPRPGGISEEKAALGAHTDFGSMVGASHHGDRLDTDAIRLHPDLPPQPTRWPPSHAAGL